MHAVWENAIRRLSEVRGLERLAPYLNVLMVVVLASGLAELSWKLVPAPQTKNDRPPSAQAASPAAGSKVSGPSRVAEWHLFGHAQPQAQNAPAAIEAPETNLNLVLRGLVYSEDQTTAYAIIAAANDEKQYAVGARLPGNVELKEIQADRVVLLHNGRYETLRLPKEGDAGGLAPAPMRPVRPAATPPPPASLQEIREDLLRNPQSFMDLMQVTPVNQDGNFVGFRVAQGRKRKLLQQFGLQEGDIITSVNGIKLDDPAQGLEALNNLRTAEEVALTILRRGSEESLTFQVK